MIPTLFATSAASAGGGILTHYVPYQILGLGVVLFALGVLFGVCAFVGAIFRRRVANVPAPAPAIAAPVVADVEIEAIDPKVVAAIAAAITVVLDQPYRIVDIHAAGHSVGMTSAWAIEGRFQHFSSHKLR